MTSTLTHEGLNPQVRLRADWIFTGTTLHHDAVLTFIPSTNKTHGEVVGVRKGEFDHDLGNRLILPGVLNAHSHAFQRAIRGKTECIDFSRGSDNFWSWRKQMYDTANRLTPSEIYEISKFAYTEMRRFGYTTVGEFHYLHNDLNGKPYEDPNCTAEAVIEAAKDAGIRIVLIKTAYKTSAPGQPANAGQKRFIYSDLDDFLTSVESLHHRYVEDPMVDVAIAAHSIRAVPPEDMIACHDCAIRLDIPFHIHACEQVKEVEQCREAYGVEPVEWLSENGVLTERTSLVHATHLQVEDLDRIEAAKASVVACPTTERDLGDGFLDVTGLYSRSVPVAIGSDSESVINPFEEIRCIEYHERLRKERRNVVGECLKKEKVGEALFESVQAGGAHSMRLNRGFLNPGQPADFMVVDLSHPSMWGIEPPPEDPLGSILAGVVFSGDTSIIEEVYVGGRSR